MREVAAARLWVCLRQRPSFLLGELTLNQGTWLIKELGLAEADGNGVPPLFEEHVRPALPSGGQ